ncbi:hypothetical protein BH23ACT9_BH23ACT9_00670 [soil metagenome]
MTPDDELLLAGALSGDLDPEEQVVFDRRLAADPLLRQQLDSLAVVAEALRRPRTAGVRGSRTSEDALMARVAADDRHAAASLPRSLRLLAASIGLVGVLAIGFAGGRVLTSPIDETLLGAPQTVVFDTAAGVEMVAAVVAHTWGTELRMELDGLLIGESYDVTYTDRSGTQRSGGSLIGSEVRIVCQLNAAVLLPDVTAITITDSAGQPVATTEI